MDIEIVKLLSGLGVGGVLGVWALIELRGMRRELGDAAEQDNAWLVAIHSRLSSLGAKELPQPERRAPRSRRGSRLRIRTAPAGVPILNEGDADE
jgi:hypothetical protein